MLISSINRLRILKIFFINAFKNVHLLSLSDKMKEVTQQPFHKLLKNSNFQPIGMNIIEKLVGLERNVINILV